MLSKSLVIAILALRDRFRGASWLIWACFRPKMGGNFLRDLAKKSFMFWSLFRPVLWYRFGVHFRGQNRLNKKQKWDQFWNLALHLRGPPVTKTENK